ncbi:phage integrase SAM-like domain-containing protein [Emticicia soli]|uniref:Phage integrase SAM-like domain-containing protein n=1 Tax=Emticicia soli TaxID=2027878 RepID=A0ABW5J5J8_9BACT
MASSVKIVLRKKKISDGTYPLAIRITLDRKTTFFHLGNNLKEADWDVANQKVRKSHPNSVRLNNLILQKKAEASDSLISLQGNKERVTLGAVRKEVSPSKQETSFFAQAAIFIDNMQKAGKYNRIKTDQTRINHFKEFLGNQDIAFADINVLLLKRFQAYLKSTRNISERTIVNHLLIIRTIYNQAIKSGLIDNKNYPFGKGKIAIKFPDSVKMGLIPEEVKTIEALELPTNSYLNHARNIWLFSFYFAGVRISDVLRMKWSDLQNDRLFYAMGKNLKAGSLKVPDKALKIIDQYRQEERKNDLIFPELKVLDSLDDTYNVQRKISYAVKRLNKALGEIAKMAELSKPLTLHISRHTFGNISGEKIPVQMLQKLYRHSNITTTIGYQANFINKTADDALEAVIGE